ncbi:MAG: DUF294 nucleotidyltransferase-like domain-containing protein [Brachymonas sp.]|nr:DUF294 nucleotidyltransferase-like domain-containing protein [Brachymonas sp.]
MPNAFDFSVSPFHSLQPQEQALVRARVDIVYYRTDEVIIDADAAPAALYILIKGQVAQMEGSSIVHIYAPQDSFDGRALMAGRSSHRFVAREEVLAYALDHATVQQLMAGNATFSALLFSGLGEKLQAMAQQGQQQEMQSLTLARVDAAMLHAPEYVGELTPVAEVARLFKEKRISHVLVRDDANNPPRLGIFSTSDLPAAIVTEMPLAELPVGQLATFGLVTLQPHRRMGEALTAMLRHRIHRVVIAEGDEVLGVIESLDVFSYLSNHSHLIITRISNAPSVQALEQAAAQTTRMVQQLYTNGTDVGLIGRLVQQVNARLFERAWDMIAPPDLVQNSCLIVMGSEGRGEQLLKTDQDNGLILCDGYTPPADLQAICQRFTDALVQIGYPPCPGGVMVSNPAWRGSVSEWQARARQWLARGNAQDLIDLAVFQDAHAVAGNPDLLEQVHGTLWQHGTHNDFLLARFAAATLAFGDVGANWLTRLFAPGDEHERLPIKKMAIFPIVQGIRSLALAQGISATSTVERIEALVQQGVLERRWGDNLIHSLHFFMGQRLKLELAALGSGPLAEAAADVQTLSSLERDLLKDTLGIVRRFKAMVRRRFRLDLIQ